RGWLMLLPLAVGLHATPASAMSWDDLWLRPDQQAQRALDSGDAQSAQKLAQDAELRGAADYRAGDFQAAVRDFGQHADGDSAYNNANALAKAQRYQEAIAAYDRALEREPGMADAIANKKAVEDWLKQQQQQQQKGDNRSGQDNDQNQKNEDSQKSD